MLFTDQAAAALVQKCRGLAATARKCKLHCKTEYVRPYKTLHGLLDRCTVCQGCHRETAAVNITPDFHDQPSERQMEILTDDVNGLDDFGIENMLQKIPPYDTRGYNFCRPGHASWEVRHQLQKAREDAPKWREWLFANKTTSELYDAVVSRKVLRAGNRHPSDIVDNII